MTARMRVICDNDLSGDPDGLYRLAHHTLSPSVDVRFVVGSHLRPGDWNDPSERTADNAKAKADETVRLLGLEGRVRTIAGSNVALDDPATPIRSQAALRSIRATPGPLRTPTAQRSPSTTPGSISPLRGPCIDEDDIRWQLEGDQLHIRPVPGRTSLEFAAIFGSVPFMRID